ncbi:hypothetical protein POTOM_050128 [Populus tomentosa]|uniref:Uncharacterized protein n=1 Tax=Populus tomentosa TaxID=118781 RepID=A0A8X7YHZ2_POPTO|nr:hypothetical protein POTOM_050128 [Populus tomentosa]
MTSNFSPLFSKLFASAYRPAFDSISNHPPAQDSTNIGGQSLALKGGAAGSLLFLLAFIIYVFLKRCDSCTIIFKVRPGDASSRPVEEA